MLRLRSTLRVYFPVALQAFPDLDSPDALELLGRAPDPDQAARLSIATITMALERARRRHVQDRTAQLAEILRTQELRQPPMLPHAYAAAVASEVAIITTLNTQIDRLGPVVADDLRILDTFLTETWRIQGPSTATVHRRRAIAA